MTHCGASGRMKATKPHLPEGSTMSQEHYNTKRRSWKQLTEKDRYKIEALLSAGLRKQEIAAQLGKSVRTIERELARGTVTQLTSDYQYVQVYKADVGQRAHEERGRNKGRALKIGYRHDYARRITELIVLEKYSPDAANAQFAKENGGERVVCTRTLYNYIWNKMIYGLGEEALPRGPRKTGRKARHRRVALNNPTGRSIEERTKQINDREEAGHWEMDTVVGKGRCCLLVLTERKHNLELVFRLSGKTQACVVKQLDRIERQLGSKRFREVFKSITCDNGCENLDSVGIERSILTKQRRTTVYYAHPYSAYERGANEGANVLIRRFAPKGSDLGKLTRADVKRIAHWMNHYPRRKLGYASAFEASPLAAILQQARVI